MRVVQSKFRQMEAFVTSLALLSFCLSISNNHPSLIPKQHSKRAEHKPGHSTQLSSHGISPLWSLYISNSVIFSVVNHFAQTAEITIRQKGPLVSNLSSVLHYNSCSGLHSYSLFLRPKLVVGGSWRATCCLVWLQRRF